MIRLVIVANSRYSELNLNQYSVGSPCRTICTVCGSPPCPDLNLIHYSLNLHPGKAAQMVHIKRHRRFQVAYAVL